MIRFWGDPISYARFEQFPGSESPLSLPVYTWTVLAPGKSDLPAAGTSKADPPPPPPIAAGEDRLLATGLPGCPYRFLESGELPFTDGNPAYGLQLHHSRFLELVGAPKSARLLGLFTTILGETAGQRTGDGGGYQPTMGRRCYVVESTDNVPVCNGNEQDVIFHDGFGPRSIAVSESRGK